MQFTSEMNWDDTDFIVWSLLLFFAGSVCLLATRKLPHSKWRGIWRMIGDDGREACRHKRKPENATA